MSTYGIKISKSGYDAGTATLENIAMSSEYGNLRIFARNNLSLTTTPYQDPGSPGTFVNYTFTIPHNLGYIPGFWAYGINNDSDNTFLLAPFPAHGEIGVSATADTTNLYVTLNMAVWSMTTDLWKGYYYIFYNQS